MARTGLFRVLLIPAATTFGGSVTEFITTSGEKVSLSWIDPEIARLPDDWFDLSKRTQLGEKVYGAFHGTDITLPLEEQWQHQSVDVTIPEELEGSYMLLFYYYDYANNVGKLAKAGDGENSIDGASGVQFAKDAGRVYYLLLDQNTGNGKMEWWDGENRETIDGGVFAFQYKGNGKAALVYDYDLVTLTGGLGYYDGKGVTKLDEDITAIFIN